MTQRTPYSPSSRPQYSPRDSGPSYNQVLEEIRTAGMIETATSVEVSPVADNEYLCVVKAVCVMPALREGDPLRRYTSLGAAYPRKNGAGVIHGVSNPAFYMHVAESRAKKRAWMDALGRGDGLEENIRSEVFAERAKTTALSVAALPVPAQVSSPDDRVTEEIAAKIIKISSLSLDEARELTRRQAAAIVRDHNEKNAS